MCIVYFTHSLTSCWNHGNAHFLRGVLRELVFLGHEVRVFEPEHGWSRTNLLQDGGASALQDFHRLFPELTVDFYDDDPDLDVMLDGADLVIVHEWTMPALVAAIGRKRLHSRFILLFHDTHHRAASDPEAIRVFDLSCYDGVLAFGESLASIYREWGWRDRVYVWHEAADTRLFHPAANSNASEAERSLVWIGNWGDGERSRELSDFLLNPAEAASLPFAVYGVRYPTAARAKIAEHGGDYRGWLPNVRVPAVFAQHRLTVHVPRHFYVRILPGIPTIRVFEALSCGVPLITAPWDDCEGLFRPGEDFLVARSGAEMARHLRDVANDQGLRATLAANGLQRITARHTCRHRAAALLRIVETVDQVERIGAD
jgi:spore maturation protein CgeB